MTITYFGFEDDSIKHVCTVNQVVTRSSGKTRYMYKCSNAEGKSFISFGDDNLTVGSTIEIGVPAKAATKKKA